MNTPETGNRIRIGFVRHAPTPWNEQRRIQGRTDIDLSPTGQALAERWRLPAHLNDWRVIASPLARTTHTAHLLCPDRDIETDSRLLEMDWGEFEGQTLESLRRDPTMADNEQRGLDFRPQGGESPRDVCDRLGEWIVEAVRHGEDCVVVSHKGVIRCAMSMAFQWNMLGKPPVKLKWQHLHLFAADTSGQLSVDEINVSL